MNILRFSKKKIYDTTSNENDNIKIFDEILHPFVSECKMILNTALGTNIINNAFVSIITDVFYYKNLYEIPLSIYSEIL